MANKIKKLASIAAIITVLIAAVPAPAPVQAFGATIVLIDLKQFALELTKSFAASMLNNVTNRYVIGFANNALKSFQIKNMNAYTLNLANQIYTNPALKDLPQDEQFVIKNVINGINGVSGKGVDLNPLFTKKALDTCNVFNVNNANAGVATYMTLAQCANPGSVPAQQAVAFTDKAKTVNSASLSKAATEINASKGFKSVYSCTSGTVTSIADCAISKSSNVISDRVSGLVNSAFHNESNPAGDKYTQYIQAMGKAVGNALASSLLSGSTSGLGSNLISDVSGLPLAVAAQAATGAGPLQGPPFTLTRFQAGYDPSGGTDYKIFAGFDAVPASNTVTATSGSTVILEWDASALAAKGADHVIFSNGDHSVDTNRSLSSFQKVTASGILNYTLTVVDSKGKTLVSDTIGVSDGSG